MANEPERQTALGEYMLSAVNTVVDVHTRVSDLTARRTARLANNCD